MERELLNQLACPACGAELVLEGFSVEQGEDVSEGVLLCDTCLVWYPISSSIPVLITFASPFHDWFARRHHQSFLRLESYDAPSGEAHPGETGVQATFTEEWAATSESDLSFSYSAEDLEELNRRVWLKSVARDGAHGEIGRVLDIGCGLGNETLALRAVLGDVEIFGVDLNLALLNSAAVRRRPAGTHFVVSSLFALPFAPASFDLVYSQGVLHHTFSTRAAFERVAAYVADAGYLFVWLYGLEDHLRTGRRGVAMRAGVAIERALRPVVSSAPAPARNAFFSAATRVAHPLLKPRMRHARRWEPQNTNTYLRDWLSPRYAHRHGWNEVIEWFEDLGFEIVDVQSPRTYRELFGDRLWGVGLTGRRRA